MPTPFRTIISLILWVVVLLESASAAPQVVTSIKPLHDLVSAVTAGVCEPILLLQGNSSPHDFSLSPSQAAAIQTADLFVWIGPALESPLARPAERLAKDRQLRLQDAPGLLILARRGDAMHDEDGGHHHHDDEDGGGPDPHLWLHPQNARSIVGVVRDALAGQDPEHAEQYRQNAARATGLLNDLEKRIQSRLAPVVERPYLVFHDGYHYFEEAFGLRSPAVYSLNPEVQPGLRHIAALRQLLSEGKIAACFAEPQFNPKVLEALTRGSGLACGTIDPLGSTTPAGFAGYLALLDDMAESFFKGLAPD